MRFGRQLLVFVASGGGGNNTSGFQRSALRSLVRHAANSAQSDMPAQWKRFPCSFIPLHRQIYSALGPTNRLQVGWRPTDVAPWTRKSNPKAQRPEAHRAPDPETGTPNRASGGSASLMRVTCAGP